MEVSPPFVSDVLLTTEYIYRNNIGTSMDMKNAKRMMFVYYGEPV